MKNPASYLGYAVVVVFVSQVLAILIDSGITEVANRIAQHYGHETTAKPSTSIFLTLVYILAYVMYRIDKAKEK